MPAVTLDRSAAGRFDHLSLAARAKALFYGGVFFLRIQYGRGEVCPKKTK